MTDTKEPRDVVEEAKTTVKTWKGQFKHMWDAHKPQLIAAVGASWVLGIMGGRKARQNLMDLTAGYDGLADLLHLARQENETLHDTIKAQALALRRLRPDLTNT